MSPGAPLPKVGKCGPQALCRQRPPRSMRELRSLGVWRPSPTSCPRSSTSSSRSAGGRSLVTAPRGLLVNTTKAVRPAVAVSARALVVSCGDLHVYGAPSPFSGPWLAWLGASASRSGPPASVAVLAGRFGVPVRPARSGPLPRAAPRLLAPWPRLAVLGSSLRSDPGTPIPGLAWVLRSARGGSSPPSPWGARVVRSRAPAAAPGSLFGASLASPPGSGGRPPSLLSVSRPPGFSRRSPVARHGAGGPSARRNRAWRSVARRAPRRRRAEITPSSLSPRRPSAFPSPRRLSAPAVLGSRPPARAVRSRRRGSLAAPAAVAASPRPPALLSAGGPSSSSTPLPLRATRRRLAPAIGRAHSGLGCSGIFPRGPVLFKTFRGFPGPALGPPGPGAHPRSVERGGTLCVFGCARPLRCGPLGRRFIFTMRAAHFLFWGPVPGENFFPTEWAGPIPDLTVPKASFAPGPAAMARGRRPCRRRSAGGDEVFRKLCPPPAPRPLPGAAGPASAGRRRGTKLSRHVFAWPRQVPITSTGRALVFVLVGAPPGILLLPAYPTAGN